MTQIPFPPFQPPLGLSLLFLLPLVMSGGMWILVQLVFAPINFLTFWHPSYLPTCQWALLTRWQHLQLKPWAPSPSLALIVMVIIFTNQSHRFLGCLALPGDLLVFTAFDPLVTPAFTVPVNISVLFISPLGLNMTFLFTLFTATLTLLLSRSM
jgi:hypothetical protein